LPSIAFPVRKNFGILHFFVDKPYRRRNDAARRRQVSEIRTYKSLHWRRNLFDVLCLLGGCTLYESRVKISEFGYDCDLGDRSGRVLIHLIRGESINLMKEVDGDMRAVVEVNRRRAMRVPLSAFLWGTALPLLSSGCGFVSHDDNVYSIDKGCVLVGEAGVITHSFKFTNTYSSVIKIVGLTKSCTCTEASVDKEQLDPGEIAHVSMSVAVPHAFRENQVFCVLKTQGHKFSEYVYSMKFVSVPRMKIEPEVLSISYDDLSSDGAIRKNLKLDVFTRRNARTAEQNLLPIKGDLPAGVKIANIVVAHPISVGNGLSKSSYDIHLEIDRDYHESKLGMRTPASLLAGPGLRETFLLEHLKSEEYEAFPSSISFGIVDGHAAPDKFVLLRSSRRSQNMWSVSSDSPCVAVELVSRGDAFAKVLVRFRGVNEQNGRSFLSGNVVFHDGRFIVAKVPWTAAVGQRLNESRSER
jgi:hypothetical protein